MNVAYVRVSSTDQNTARQLEALRQYNLDRIYEEHISGKDKNRPQLQAMLADVGTGDTVYIESISRLARNTKDLLEIVESLTERGVDLVSLKEALDTSTPTGKFVLTMFGALAELERETIRQRQREGIDINRAQNKPYGRPRIAITQRFVDAHRRWRAGEITAREAMRLSKIKKSTFYNVVKEYEAQLT